MTALERLRRRGLVERGGGDWSIVDLFDKPSYSDVFGLAGLSRAGRVAGPFAPDCRPLPRRPARPWSPRLQHRPSPARRSSRRAGSPLPPRCSRRAGSLYVCSPTLQSAPILAPGIKWAKAQMRVPGPIESVSTRARSCMNGGSGIGSRLCRFGRPFGGLRSRRQLADLLECLHAGAAQLQHRGCQVLLEVLDRARPWNREHDRRVVKQPRQRDLCGNRVVRGGDLGEPASPAGLSVRRRGGG